MGCESRCVGTQTLGCAWDESGTYKALCCDRWRVGEGLQVLLGLWIMLGA